MKNEKQFLRYGKMLCGMLAAVLLTGCGAQNTVLREEYRMEGITLLNSARYEEAEEAFLSSLALSDGIVTDMDIDMNLYLAECYRGMDDTERVLEVYDSILALRPSHVEALYARGCTRLLLENTSGAIADFDTACRVDPYDFELQLRICLAMEAAGYTDLARRRLDSVRGTYGASMSDYEKGRYAFYMGNNAEAASLLEKALTVAKGEERAQCALLLGRIAEMQNDPGYAFQIYTDAITEGASQAELYNRRGLCYLAQQDYESALADFETGLSLGETAGQQALMRNRITAHEYAGNFRTAKQLMEEYISRYPDDGEAAREAIFLRTR